MKEIVLDDFSIIEKWTSLRILGGYVNDQIFAEHLLEQEEESSDRKLTTEDIVRAFSSSSTPDSATETKSGLKDTEISTSHDDVKLCRRSTRIMLHKCDAPVLICKKEKLIYSKAPKCKQPASKSRKKGTSSKSKKKKAQSVRNLIPKRNVKFLDRLPLPFREQTGAKLENTIKVEPLIDENDVGVPQSQPTTCFEADIAKLITNPDAVETQTKLKEPLRTPDCSDNNIAEEDEFSDEDFVVDEDCQSDDEDFSYEAEILKQRRVTRKRCVSNVKKAISFDSLADDGNNGQDESSSQSPVKKKNNRVVVKESAAHYYCSVCKFRSSNQLELLKHYSLSCFESSDLPSRPTLKRRSRTRVQPVLIDEECFCCTERFCDSISLCDHLLTHRQFACSCCPVFYSNEEELKQHKQKSGHLETVHSCDVCKTKYTHKFKLVLHMNVHNKVRKYYCNLCDAIFDNSKRLFHHKKTMHENIIPENFNLRTCSSKSKSEQLYVCDGCGKTFYNEKKWKIHGLVHSNVKPFICDVCGNSFFSIKNLGNHKRRCHRPAKFACDVCGKKYRKCADWKGHMNTHTGLKPYICQVCGKGFHSSDGRSGHMQTHQELKHCKHCHIACRTMKMLFLHMNKTHAELIERGIIDLNNPDTFKKSREQVLEYEKSIKRYKCKFCDTSYSRVEALFKHGKKFHPEKISQKTLEDWKYRRGGKRKRQDISELLDNESDIAPYKCTYCPKDYRDLNYMKVHMAKWHRKELERDKMAVVNGGGGGD